MLVFYYIVCFVVGAVIGSFLNVCISRLPYEKSLIWPLGSRCFHCLKPIRAIDNVPLISYWLLGGKCRHCGAAFSMRYFWIELLTAVSFVLLFHLEVVENVHGLAMIQPVAMRQIGFIPWQAWVFWGHHALLLSLLIIVAVCDWNEREIPLGVTLFGTFVGLVLSMIEAWPWPYSVEKVVLPGPAWGFVNFRVALYPWPIWWPTPPWLPQPGTWQYGLATGLAGMLMGSLLLRSVRFLFNTGLGAKYLEARGGDALGLGDADLMMMAGAFLGWQPILVAFFLSVIPGMLFGLVQLAVNRSAALPFGPALAGGVILTWLSWHWLGPNLAPVFFNDTLVLMLLGGSAFFLLLASLLLRALRFLREG